MKKRFILLVVLAGWLGIDVIARGDSPLAVTSFNRTGTNTALRFDPLPGIDVYSILSSSNLSAAFTTNSNFSWLPTGQPEYVLDNTAATVSGTWSTGTSSTDRYGASYRYKSPGLGAAYLQFTPNLAQAGTYQVYTWHPQGTNRTTGAPHVITYNGGTTTVYVNQKINGGTWNLLGQFNFAAGASGNVRITDAASDAPQIVMADAIRFVGVGLPPTTNVLTPQGYEWRANEAGPQNFYRVQASAMSSNSVVSSTVLNRLAYGPTPDDLTNIAAIGPDAYINQQLNFQLLSEAVTNSHTNLAFIETKFAYATDIVDFNYVQTFSTNTNGVVTTNNIYSSTNASISDLRAYHVLRAVGAKRQLLETMLQWLENHFVTQYSKSVAYIDGKYTDNGTIEDRLATQFEFLENCYWRNALLNSQCTFQDLLKISAQSPAMIIYLDTAGSRGDSANIPNENYARELMELFTMGVDNGYDQNDITILSRCWAGWDVGKVAQTNAFNPFATNLLRISTSNSTNAPGVWAFNYRPDHQNASNQVVFAGKTVPARFGAPWAGTSYQLNVTGRSGTNGIQEGYQVITHLANLPFTEEFICVKLCRLFVHDNFTHGVYDYTDPNLSPEAKLVHDCMLAWETAPKGQIRLVLQTIFNSALFRGQAAAMQKVKTPLEFCVSAIRALRTSTNGTYLPGSYSSDTDGYSISGDTRSATGYPLNRMGTMLLFDRNDPNGYSEDAAGWISAGTLTERIRFVQTYCMTNSDSSKGDNISGGNKNVSDPVALLINRLPQQNPPGSLTSSANVADYFLSILFPSEGRANLSLYRAAAIRFLDTADDNVSSSPLLNLSTNSTTYNDRIRGLVALLMSYQRFNEQ